MSVYSQRDCASVYELLKSIRDAHNAIDSNTPLTARAKEEQHAAVDCRFRDDLLSALGSLAAGAPAGTGVPVLTLSAPPRA